ncbi:threonylcarbamoyl-AMP synthase [candidate division KSB1 bacterium 4572_119]|nr:MAG: threonylcarbamoyl-AMP synthase [candidate division KSB1 bacterium 4572_119]
MKNILKINPEKPDINLLQKAAGILKDGGIIGYPTETIYGLGADVFNDEAVEKIYRLKGRDKNKPILIIAASLDQVKELIVSFPEKAVVLTQEFWPGPLTIVFDASPRLNKSITGKQQTVGIRIPNNQICLELIKFAGVPITSTSANLTGNKNPVTAREVAENFGDRLNLILDGGQSNSATPSTVISVINNGIKIIREGAISKFSIMKILGNKIDE